MCAQLAQQFRRGQNNKTDNGFNKGQSVCSIRDKKGENPNISTRNASNATRATGNFSTKENTNRAHRQNGILQITFRPLANVLYLFKIHWTCEELFNNVTNDLKMIVDPRWSLVHSTTTMFVSLTHSSRRALSVGAVILNTVSWMYVLPNSICQMGLLNYKKSSIESDVMIMYEIANLEPWSTLQQLTLSSARVWPKYK